MDIFHIEGPVRLSGSVKINGSKNASLPIMAASILAKGKSVISSVPHLSDISVCGQLLSQLGCTISRSSNGDLCIDSTVIDNPAGQYLHTRPPARPLRQGRSIDAWWLRNR
ncbi:MAG: hypothetical protein ACYS91_12395 [Planctomycetota bacterium]